LWPNCTHTRWRWKYFQNRKRKCIFNHLGITSTDIIRLSYVNELQDIQRANVVIDIDVCGIWSSASFYITKDRLYKILILNVNKNNIFCVKKSFQFFGRIQSVLDIIELCAILFKFANCKIVKYYEYNILKALEMSVNFAPCYERFNYPLELFFYGNKYLVRESKLLLM
jgi:hypothetical protein